jgi:nuclear pore complex protein Nup205
MVMFSRIAETITGANCLIDFRILELLGECQYLDRYPDFSMEFNESMFPITAHDTFHDIFTAVLELILGLMGHNLPNQAQIFEKVITFINNHQQTFIAILKNSSLITLSYLLEVKLITGIFTLLGSNCKEFIARPMHGPGNVSFISLMIQVLTNFSTQEWRLKFVPTSDVEKEKQKSQVLVYVSGSNHSISHLNVLEEEGTRLSEEICRNILGVIKNNISGKSQKGMMFK